MSSTQKRSWTMSWPARASMSAYGVVGEQADDRVGEGGRVARRHEEAGPAVVHHLRDAADARGDHRPGQRHRFEDREALGLPVGGQHRHVEGGGDGRDVVPAAGEDDAAGDAPVGRLRLQLGAPAALADHQEVRHRDPLQDQRPRVDERGVALLRLQAGDDARRSGCRAPCRIPRGACSTAPGGCSARGPPRCR